jgi:hypothetical protein
LQPAWLVAKDLRHASLIAADFNKQRSIAGHEWRRNRDPARSRREVKEYLATRRYRVGRSQRRRAEVCFAVRSRGPTDRRSQGTSILRLLGQLSDRLKFGVIDVPRTSARKPPALPDAATATSVRSTTMIDPTARARPLTEAALLRRVRFRGRA